VRSNEGYYAVIESIESRPAANNGNAMVGAIIGGVMAGSLGIKWGQGAVTTWLPLLAQQVAHWSATKSAKQTNDRTSIRFAFDSTTTVIKP
jgi:hypothetical protein